jgi:hypothetical protein
MASTVYLVKPGSVGVLLPNLKAKVITCTLTYLVTVLVWSVFLLLKIIKNINIIVL